MQKCVYSLCVYTHTNGAKEFPGSLGMPAAAEQRGGV